MEPSGRISLRVGDLDFSFTKLRAALADAGAIETVDHPSDNVSHRSEEAALIFINVKGLGSVSTVAMDGDAPLQKIRYRREMS